MAQKLLDSGWNDQLKSYAKSDFCFNI